MSPWNYARTWATIASVVPEREAIVTDRGQRVTYAALRDRAHRLAELFAGAGIGSGDAVGIALHNRPEYLEVFWAALAVGAAPANVNYQYGAEELEYVLSDCNAAAVVFETDLAAKVDVARERARDWSPRLLLGVGDGELPPDFLAYDTAMIPDAMPTAPFGYVPSPDDTMLLYTGGTTGMPKGVVWRVEDYFLMGWEIGRPGTTPPEPERAMRDGKRATTFLPASPLVHGTALGLATQTLCGGGTVVLRGDPRLDAAVLLDLVEREEVAVLGIVGDTFARPIIAELERTHATRELRRLRAIVSSGMRFSAQHKSRLVELIPWITIVDSLGSSEGMMTRSTISARDGNGADTDFTSFARSELVRVVTDDGRDAVPGSGDEGLLMVSGHLPLRYHNDAQKSAETFRTIDGIRFAVPGDRARVRADGRIELLGRGSACINTGGEKVYPQEVEDVLRRHQTVRDAAVLGIPDERWGEMVVAVVESLPNGSPSDVDALGAELALLCREHLAGYKHPKRYVVVDELPRTVAGKPDTVRLREYAADASDDDAAA